MVVNLCIYSDDDELYRDVEEFIKLVVPHIKGLPINSAVDLQLRMDFCSIEYSFIKRIAGAQVRKGQGSTELFQSVAGWIDTTQFAKQIQYEDSKMLAIF